MMKPNTNQMLPEKFKDFIKQYFENKLGIEITGIVLHSMLCYIWYKLLYIQGLS
jgi:hypothetical protein